MQGYRTAINYYFLLMPMQKSSPLLHILRKDILWWKTEVVPQPFRIRYRSALWLRSNFLNPSEFPPCILTCSKKFLPWGWAICWAISWDVRGIWSIAPTKCRSLSERPPDLSVPQCVTLSVWERRNNFLTQSAEVTNAKVTNANAH